MQQSQCVAEALDLVLSFDKAMSLPSGELDEDLIPDSSRRLILASSIITAVDVLRWVLDDEGSGFPEAMAQMRTEIGCH